MTDTIKGLCAAIADPAIAYARKVTSAGTVEAGPELARVVTAVIGKLADLGSNGDWPRYEAGDWSRRNIEAFVADLLGEMERIPPKPAGPLSPNCSCNGLPDRYLSHMHVSGESFCSICFTRSPRAPRCEFGLTTAVRRAQRKVFDAETEALAGA